MHSELASEIADMAVATVMDTLAGGLIDELKHGRFLRRDDFDTAREDIARAVDEKLKEWMSDGQ